MWAETSEKQGLSYDLITKHIKDLIMKRKDQGKNPNAPGANNNIYHDYYNYDAKK